LFECAPKLAGFYEKLYKGRNTGEVLAKVQNEGLPPKRKKKEVASKETEP